MRQSCRELSRVVERVGMFQSEDAVHSLQHISVLNLGFSKLALSNERDRQITAAVKGDTIFRSECFLFRTDNLTTLYFCLCILSFVVQYFGKIIATHECVRVFGSNQF